MMEYRLSYPGAEGGFFDLGVKALDERLPNYNLTEKFLFIQFEVPFLGELLPSKFVDILLNYSEKEIILVCSVELLPLARLYSQFFMSVVGIIENSCSLRDIELRLLSGTFFNAESLFKSVIFTMRQALILESFYQGTSIKLVAEKFKIETKTAYFYKRYIAKKLSLKNICHLTM